MLQSSTYGAILTKLVTHITYNIGKFYKLIDRFIQFKQ